ncbi:hypothetical protein ACFE04_019976 [Oxalis oulophora]
MKVEKVILGKHKRDEEDGASGSNKMRREENNNNNNNSASPIHRKRIREEFDGGEQLGSVNEERRTDQSSTCAICNRGDGLLFCAGKGCKNAYHPGCLDPPLDRILPRIWHCTLCKSSELSLKRLPLAYNCHLSYVNKLCGFLSEGRNALCIDEHTDQERVLKVILFILSSQSSNSMPFLVISSPKTLSVWEDEFLRIAPSTNVVVYKGNKTLRSSIQSSKFFNEKGCTMFQVLLSSSDVIAEDVEVFQYIGWEAIIIDECQRSTMSKHFENFNLLSLKKMMLLLQSSQLKVSVTDYLGLLYLLDSESHESNINTMDVDSVSDIDKAKKLLERYIAYECKSGFTRFIEHWVPVPLSDLQLEQYCSTLFSQALFLCSKMKNDLADVLREMILSVQKCCDHPFLVDPSLRAVVAKGVEKENYLDAEINASRKLQFLDKFLSEMKTQGFRVLILFQNAVTTGKESSVGDFLDGLICERFGENSYERIDGKGMKPSKKQDSLNNFNDEKCGRFVLLMDTQACRSNVKLNSVDTVIIFNSNYDPLSDLKALQKITISSRFHRIKLFRLYSPYTVEEKALILAKEGMTLDSSIQNFYWKTCNELLTWGASHLFQKLDELHGSNTSSDSSFFDHVLGDLLIQVSSKSSDCSVLSKISENGYGKDIELLGEKYSLAKKESPTVFWTNLLKGRHPVWKFLPMSSSSLTVRRKGQDVKHTNISDPDDNSVIKLSPRKVVKCADGPRSRPKDNTKQLQDIVKNINVSKPDDNSVRKLSPPKVVKCVVDPKSRSKNNTKPDIVKHVKVSESDDNSVIRLSSQKENTEPVHVDKGEIIPDGKYNLDQSTQSSLETKLIQLCEKLELPEIVKDTALFFLDFMIKQYNVSWKTEPQRQGFQMSLCWAGASLSKHDINHKDILAQAKNLFNFDSEKEAYCIYSKLEDAMKVFASEVLPMRNMWTGPSTESSSVFSGEKHYNSSKLQDIAPVPLSLEVGKIQKGDGEPSLGCRREDNCVSASPIGELHEIRSDDVKVTEDITCLEKIEVPREMDVDKEQELDSKDEKEICCKRMGDANETKNYASQQQDLEEGEICRDGISEEPCRELTPPSNRGKNQEICDTKEEEKEICCKRMGNAKETKNSASQQLGLEEGEICSDGIGGEPCKELTPAFNQVENHESSSCLRERQEICDTKEEEQEICCKRLGNAKEATNSTTQQLELEEGEICSDGIGGEPCKELTPGSNQGVNRESSSCLRERQEISDPKEEEKEICHKKMGNAKEATNSVSQQLDLEEGEICSTGVGEEPCREQSAGSNPEENRENSSCLIERHEIGDKIMDNAKETENTAPEHGGLEETEICTNDIGRAASREHTPGSSEGEIRENSSFLWGRQEICGNIVDKEKVLKDVSSELLGLEEQKICSSGIGGAVSGEHALDRIGGDNRDNSDFSKEIQEICGKVMNNANSAKDNSSDVLNLQERDTPGGEDKHDGSIHVREFPENSVQRKGEFLLEQEPLPPNVMSHAENQNEGNFHCEMSETFGHSLHEMENLLLQDAAMLSTEFQPSCKTFENDVLPHLDSLENEMKMNRDEKDKLMKTYGDKILEVNCEREMEIRKVDEEISAKYDTMLQNSEAAFLQKKNDLEMQDKMVIQNMSLAKSWADCFADHNKTSSGSSAYFSGFTATPVWETPTEPARRHQQVLAENYTSTRLPQQTNSTLPISSISARHSSGPTMSLLPHHQVSGRQPMMRRQATPTVHHQVSGRRLMMRRQATPTGLYPMNSRVLPTQQHFHPSSLANNNPPLQYFGNLIGSQSPAAYIPTISPFANQGLPELHGPIRENTYYIPRMMQAQWAAAGFTSQPNVTGSVPHPGFNSDK